MYVLEASTSNRLTYFLPPLVRFRPFYFSKLMLCSLYCVYSFRTRRAGLWRSLGGEVDERDTNILNGLDWSCYWP